LLGDRVSTGLFIFLIGTRWNSPDRVVTREESRETARSFGIPDFEMDAETAEEVEDGFFTIVREGINEISQEKVEKYMWFM
jgi:hypothetical protein